MNSILTDGTCYVQNSVAFSRNMEEKWEISNKNITYSKLAGMLLQNLDTIDRMIEGGSEFAGQYAAAAMAEHQYHNPQNNSFMNFINRNVHIDPVTKEKYALQRQGVYAATRSVSEFLLKNAVRMYLNHEKEKTKYRIYREMYSLMTCFVNSDRQVPGYSRASRELSKIRSSFDLSQKDLIKIKKDVDQSQVPSAYPVNYEILGNLNDESRYGLSFCLTALAAQMYDDIEMIKSRLSSYFDLLGYHGNRQREVIRANSSDYDKILEQQHRMHIIASQMVQNLTPSIPQIDIAEIFKRSQDIKRFDPYEDRRNNNRKIIDKAVKPVFKTLIACCQKYPALSLLASLEALSQFNLNNDNIVGECSNKLRQWFGSDSDAETTIKNAKQISDSAKAFL